MGHIQKTVGKNADGFFPLELPSMTAGTFSCKFQDLFLPCLQCFDLPCITGVRFLVAGSVIPAHITEAVCFSKICTEMLSEPDTLCIFPIFLVRLLFRAYLLFRLDPADSADCLSGFFGKIFDTAFSSDLAFQAQ